MTDISESHSICVRLQQKLLDFTGEMELTSRIFFLQSVIRNDHEIGITILRRISSHVHELQNISMSEKYNWKDRDSITWLTVTERVDIS